MCHLNKARRLFAVYYPIIPLPPTSKTGSRCSTHRCTNVSNLSNDFVGAIDLSVIPAKFPTLPEVAREARLFLANEPSL